MAKGAKQTTGTSKIRFIVLEAEIDGGDLSEITSAIQNALKPKSTVEQRIIQIEGKATIPDIDFDEVIYEPFEDDVPSPTTKKRAAPAQKRTFSTPTVVDVDWKIEPSIEAFMSDHAASSTADKYLSVLAWFNDKAGIEAVTSNHVYTAFRKLGWSTAIKDFSQPLRDLKVQQVITGGGKDGFKINHLGLDRISKLSTAR
jgi:hypothetical protein